MDKDFLLDSDWARQLYHEHAAKMPIIDYHCHLSPKEIAEDHRFRSITELWLGGDHYKWRAMRANGVDERYITGDASDWEKFQKWAETVPYLFRNPLYHWTHLELTTAFGIDKLLTPETAREIYDECNRLLALPGYTAQGLMLRYGVEAVCTTDDPVDSLEYHKQIRESGFAVKVLPAWRPDKATAGDPAYIKRLSDVSGVEIKDKASLVQALQLRHDFFAEQGCVLADHGLSEIEPNELLIELCRMNHAAGWAQQFHFGALRNVNSRMYAVLGPDTGFDTIGDWTGAQQMARLLDILDKDNRLAPTILYNLNPSDNTWVAAMIGCFQDGTMPGKMQMGAAWWFNDQLLGMEAQLNTLSTQGLLSRFVGMLTDSRSFLSYPRHEYFRRLLCRMLGHDIEQGMIPEAEMPRVGQMVEDICYYNIKNYLKI